MGEKTEKIPTNSDTKSDSDPKTDSDTKSDSEDKKSPEDDSATRAFECNICLDTASDAVISMCGHLFCWPCLHQRLELAVIKLCHFMDVMVTKKILEKNLFHQGQEVKDRNRNQLVAPMAANLATCSIPEAFKCLSASELFLLDFLQQISIGDKKATIKDLHLDQLSLMKNN